MKAMARLEAQESIEYYQWLFRIEREQFEKEFLEIVSKHYIYIYIHIYIYVYIYIYFYDYLTWKELPFFKSATHNHQIANNFMVT